VAAENHRPTQGLPEAFRRMGHSRSDIVELLHRLLPDADVSLDRYEPLVSPTDCPTCCWPTSGETYLSRSTWRAPNATCGYHDSSAVSS